MGFSEKHKEIIANIDQRYIDSTSKKIYDSKGKEKKDNHNLSPPVEEDNPLIQSSAIDSYSYVFPSYIPQIDFILPKDLRGRRRGIPAGTFFHVCGLSNSYKTSILDRFAINTLNAGGAVYRINATDNWDSRYFASGILGKIEKRSKFRRKRCNSFSEVFNYVESILIGYKELVYEYRNEWNKRYKKDQKSFSDIFLPIDIYPVMIIIDDFGSLFSETSLGNNFGQTKTAEENTDIHRSFKLWLPLMRYLGIPILIGNQYRANINHGVSYGPNKNPYAWKSMEYYVTNAIDLYAKRTERTSNKKKYKDIEIILPSIRKLKGEGYAENKIPGIKFHKRHGFDIAHGVFEVLKECGYVEETDKFIEFKTETDSGLPLPSSFEKYAGKHKKTEFFRIIKKRGVQRIVVDYFMSQGEIDKTWAKDDRMLSNADMLINKIDEKLRGEDEEETEEEIEAEEEEFEENDEEVEEEDESEAKQKARELLEKTIQEEENPEEDNPLEKEDEE